MGMTIISKRQRVESESFTLFFGRIDMPGAGYSLNCTESGELLGDEWRTKQQREQQAAELRADPDYAEPYVQRMTHSCIEPAVGRCGCGNKVALPDPLFNECERCGRWWNMCGQEKINPNSELCRAIDAEEGERYGIDY